MNISGIYCTEILAMGAALIMYTDRRTERKELQINDRTGKTIVISDLKTTPTRLNLFYTADRQWVMCLMS